MSLGGLHIADVVVIILYLLGITTLGLWMARRVKTASDFFMPRRFGKAMMIANAFGTGTASDQAVTVASATFKSGLSGIWWQWIWLPATPFYWLIAPMMRRLRATTTADAYELRYSRSVAALFAVVGIVGLSVKIGLMLKGAGVLVESSTGGSVSANVAILAVTVLFVAYGTAGGLAAAIVTDFFQGLLTIAFSVILLPFILNAVGGLEGIRDTIKDPAMLQFVSPAGIGPFFIIMFSIQALVGIVAQPFIMGVCASGRTEMDGRVGFMFGNIVKRICTMAWCVTALAAVAWYLQRGILPAEVKPDHVYGDVARAFLPQVVPGLLGVFLASILASVMSSCDAFMISSSGLFTENIYRPLWPKRPERHYLTVGRLASLLVVGGGLLFAWWVPNVVDALKIWFKIAPMMGIVFWLGLFWRRATPIGAWAATVTGFSTWWLSTNSHVVNFIADLSFADHWGLIVWKSGQTASLYEPWVIVFYLTSALLAGVVGSLLSKPVQREKLDTFYALIRTPIVEGEVVRKPCTLPEGSLTATRKFLSTSWGLELPIPSTTSVVGFLGGWVCVFALIGGFLWVMEL